MKISLVRPGRSKEFNMFSRGFNFPVYTSSNRYFRISANLMYFKVLVWEKRRIMEKFIEDKKAPLFNDGSLDQFLNTNMRKMMRMAGELTTNQVLVKEDSLEILMNEARFMVPTINVDEMAVTSDEKLVEVPDHPDKAFSSTGVVDVDGTEILFYVPYSGDAKLFKYKPNNYVHTPTGSAIRVKGRMLEISFCGVEPEKEDIERRFKKEIDNIQENLKNVKIQVEAYHKEIEKKMLNYLEKWEEDILTGKRLADALRASLRKS